MNGLRWLVICLALMEAGWMVFDGNRALYHGDYVTATNGSEAGQLGPWAKVVEAAGIEPRSILMKSIFVGYGTVWLFIIALFALKKSLTWDLMLLAAIASLWYLPVGTLFSGLQIVILSVLRWKEAARHA